MRNLSLAVALAASIGFATGIAKAADMPVKAAPPVAAPALYNWTGFYIGPEGGAIMGQQSHMRFGGKFGPFLLECASVDDSPTICNTNVPTTAKTIPNADVGHPLHGGFVGGEAGFNLQVGRWVFGVEGDGQWAELEEALTCPNPLFFCGSKIRDFETIRGRIGYAFGPTGTFLAYVTGGAVSASQSYSSGVLAPPFATINEWKRTVGWTAGIGAEYGITPWLSVKGEVLYVALEDRDYPGEQSGACAIFSSTVPCAFQPVHIKHNFVAARMGLNWRFNWGKGKAPAAVVASY